MGRNWILQLLYTILTISSLVSCNQGGKNLDRQLSKIIREQVLSPLPPPEPTSQELVDLGEALFWDPELSGNRDTSCATCHHPSFGTGDGLSLPVGTGGHGVGMLRRLGENRDFVPRNANPLYNLGYPEWDIMFWDGRVEGDASNGYENPAGDDLPDGLVNALAVQAMFPVTSRDEMRGDRGDDDILGVETELGWIKDVNPEQMWDALITRLLDIPAYRDLFLQAYPGVKIENLGFEHAANAIAAYESAAFSSIDTPWDRYLSGELDALSEGAKIGAILFYGEAGCSDCHSGDHFTDWDFHNLAIPHIGPGKDPESPLDYGRARVTGDDCDLFAFRTPPLRNVSLTGPWMHNGAYTTLEGAVLHHLNPVAALQNYDPSQISMELVNLTTILGPDNTTLLTCGTAYKEVTIITDAQVRALLLFLNALTSPTAADAAHLVPDSVPSGLPVGGQ